MPKLSVPQAAERLGVSQIRVRQRIEEGSLVAEKVGGRWLVDLSAVPRNRPRGRPVKPELVWEAIRCVGAAERLKRDRGRPFEEALQRAYAEARWPSSDASREPDLLLPDGSVVEFKVSQSSRRRALLRLLELADPAPQEGDRQRIEALLRWLGGRADRRLYRAAGPDLNELRNDDRVIASGLSHPRSGMQDPRVIEGYIAADDLESLVSDHWLDRPGVDAPPNVFLHVALGRPEFVSPLMVAADLFEHEGPRERARAIQLVTEEFA